jgi:branched-chain amino acid transport system permease protein
VRTKKSIIILAALIVLAIVLSTMPFVLGAYLLSVLVLLLIYILPAMSMRVSLLAGQTNIGVVAFFAIGGYASAILSMKLEVPVIVALVGGGLVAAIVGLLLGSVIMKMGDLYFLILTWGFLELVRSVAIKAVPLTNGPFGLVNIPPLSIGGLVLSRVPEYFFILFVTLLVLVLLYRVEYSRLGLTWKGIAQAPNLSESVGVNVYRLKLVSFIISCFVAGLGGALYAHHMGVLQPGTFTFLLATTVIIWNVLGGVGSYWGPIVGTVFLLLLVEPLRGLESFEMITYAAILIVVIILLPGGLITLPKRLRPLIKRLRRKGETAKADAEGGGA